MDKDPQISVIIDTDMPDRVWLQISDIVMPFCRNAIELKLCHSLANELWKEALRAANEQLIIQSIEDTGDNIEITARKNLRTEEKE